jgi:hypothetical protein
MDVSALVGIPQSHVSAIERGTRTVTTLALFERFADGLGIPRRPLGLADAAVVPDPEDRVAASQRDWLRTRRRLNLHRPQLSMLAASLYPPPSVLDESGVLMPAAWRPAAPVALENVAVELDPMAPTGVVGGEHESRPVRPLCDDQRHYDRYHRAMRDIDRPRLFENRLSYRMLGIGWEQGTGHLRVGYQRYFDMIDVGEAAAHELTLATVDRRGGLHPDRASWDHLPFRRLLADPFELRAYPLLLSISTLTIRRSRAGCTFVLLKRDAGKVAIAGDMLSVMPTGVFQPASIAPAVDDLDLWHNMMREYSEEFLGCPEHDGNGPPIDYTEDEPFRSLDRARTSGRIRVWAVGAGIDALNLVSDLFTVAVFDAETFDAVFDRLVEVNEEGTVTRRSGGEELTFDADTVHRLLTSGRLAPSGAACLSLAWAHRQHLLA